MRCATLSLQLVIIRLTFIFFNLLLFQIGIVGRTGAGKSSLLNMMFRMGVNTGTITVDGYDINNLTLETLRNTISVIPQVNCDSYDIPF